MGIIFGISIRKVVRAVCFVASLSCLHASEQVAFKSKIVEADRAQFIAQVGIARLGEGGGAMVSALLIQRVVMRAVEVEGAKQSSDPRFVPVERAQTQVQLRWNGNLKRFEYIGPRSDLKLMDGCAYFYDGERVVLIKRYSVDDILFIGDSDVDGLILEMVAEVTRQTNP